MAHFLLVHGSGHGAWCWRDVVPALEARGHSAEAMDLPGAGEDPTPLAEVTLAAYGAAIAARLTRRSILVGHSAGGFAISEAAELAADRIARLVYLCAYVPAPGMSLAEMRRAADEQPLRGKLEVSQDGLAFRFRHDGALEDCLYGDCPEGTIAYAEPRLSWQPVAPQETPVSGSRATTLPRAAILCKNDRTIAPSHQRAMAAAIADRFELDTGHSPFFADPDRLAATLDRIAAATQDGAQGEAQDAT